MDPRDYNNNFVDPIVGLHQTESGNLLKDLLQTMQIGDRTQRILFWVLDTITHPSNWLSRAKIQQQQYFLGVTKNGLLYVCNDISFAAMFTILCTEHPRQPRRKTLQLYYQGNPILAHPKSGQAIIGPSGQQSITFSSVQTQINGTSMYCWIEAGSPTIFWHVGLNLADISLHFPKDCCIPEQLPPRTKPLCCRWVWIGGMGDNVLESKQLHCQIYQWDPQKRGTNGRDVPQLSATQKDNVITEKQDVINIDISSDSNV